MNATLQAHSLKHFKKILQCIAKFGEQLQIQATHTELSLSAVNSSKSAFCLFLLDADTFFHRYELTGTAAEGGGGVKCKLFVKSVMSVLGRGQQQSVDTLQLQIVDAEGVAPTRKRRQGRRRAEEDEDDEARSSIQAKLILVLNCKHGVVKKHSLNLSPCDCLIAETDPSACANTFTVPARTLKDWIEHFSVSSGSASITKTNTSHGAGGGGGGGAAIKYENELGWYFAQGEVRVKTMEANRPSAQTRLGLSTEIRIAPEEFDEYVLEHGPVQLAFPLREFRAAFQLAESWSIPLHVKFGHALDPMLVSLDIEGVRAEFVMATIESDVFPPGEQTVKTDKVKSEPKPPGSAKRNAVAEEGRTVPGTTGKRKRTSLALVEGQQQDDVGPNSQNGLHHASQLGNRSQLDPMAPLAPGPSQQFHAAEPEYDLDFQPNGTLNPAPLLPDEPPREPQQPLFFASQGDDSDGEKNAHRQALLRQSQAEVDALDPEELAQLMDDDPDITMDGAEETYLGPTQPAVEDDEEVMPESGNRRSYHALFDD